MQEPRSDLPRWATGWSVSKENMQALFLLQQKANARNYAVFRTGRGNPLAKSNMSLVTDNFADGKVGAEAIAKAYGDVFTEHIEYSMLPLMWNGTEETSTAETPDFGHFSNHLKERVLPFSGIAFPVKLGAAGNGYVVLTATYMDLPADLIIDLHLQSTNAMIELLQGDVRYSKATELLSEREVACLQMAGDGLTSDEVAVKLGLSVHTVNAYLGAATGKLDSVNRIQAIAKAIRLGYIN